MLIIALSLIYYLNNPVFSSKVIYIPQGSIQSIISQMKQSNYAVSNIDVWLLRAMGSPQSGWIDLGSGVNSRADFLYKLTTSKAALTSITLIPGETTHIFLDQLSSQLSLDRSKLESEFRSLSSMSEGVFVPNTYALPIGISEYMTIRTLYTQSQKQMRSLSQKIFGSYNEKKWFHFVTIASIIEKEAANIDEMPLVSSVIHNRLKKNMPLQMDGTLNYGEFSHTKVTAKRIREDESHYNTYKNRGLPKAPVCNVSFNALRAAIFPAKTPYLYFMKNRNGTHNFTRYYSTHLSNISDATK